MITLDTSALLAILNAGDQYHTQVTTALRGDHGPYIVPVGMLGELAYMIETRYGLRVLDLFLSDCESGAYLLHCGEDDIPRIRALVRRYADLPLGFADAAVIACAERHGGRVLTLDLRHVGTVAREGTLTVLPE
jgi:hypothetical protein